jgi:ribosomal protein L29
MQYLLDQVPVDKNGQSESVCNIAARYDDIADYFPEELEGSSLVYFVDWLLENVHLVEIEAFSDEEAYTIFETMNDRGLSLSLAEMLKGYVLANITHETDQRMVNDTWKNHMQGLKAMGEEEDVDFFKNWLRARHAETIRPGKKGAENKDYERIGTEFHRWVRDAKDILKLTGSDAFVRFVQHDIDFYARQTLAIRKAATTLTAGWESVRYVEERGFTLQTQVLLASLSPDDAPEVVRRKVALVADFLDIWLARRAWNFRTTSYSSVKYTIFMLTKELRGKSLDELSAYLRQQLDEQSETFARQPRYRMHQQNYRQVRHTLARLTHWVDQQCGLMSHFEALISQGQGRPFEIEHIWSDQYERFAELYAHPSDFDEARNRLGGLLLLQRGLNQSLGDMSYEKKRDAYLGHSQNLLARSLHPIAYQNNPAFARLIEKTGLPFRAYEVFGPAEQVERQELYIRIAEWVWNPSRLDLDGEKPPIPEPIAEPEDESADSVDRPGRHVARMAFWTELLAYSKERDTLHVNISPSHYGWIGARKHGQWWNYVVLQDETRVELYLDDADPSLNKAAFDVLCLQRDAIESAFGGSLLWQRLDDKRASRISFSVSGGWVDQKTWLTTIQQAVSAMKRLYNAFAQTVEALRLSVVS